MNLRQLEAFREVMSSGNVSAAAARINVSQPTMSRLLAELESSAGFKLFDHRRGKITPRAEAFAFLDEVDRALYGLSHLRRAADEIRRSGGLRLRIISFPALGHSLLPDIIAAFTAEHPGTRLSVSIRSSRYVLEALSTGSADIGICGTAVARPGLRLERRFTAECVCLLPSEHSLAEAEAIDLTRIEPESIVWLDPGSQIEPALRRAIGGKGRANRSNLEVNLGITAYQLVQKRIGIAILDPLTAACRFGEDLVTKPVSPTIAFEFSIFRSATGYSEAAEHFMERLIEHCERALGVPRP